MVLVMSVDLDRVLSQGLGRTDYSSTLTPRLKDVQSEESLSEVVVTVGVPEVKRDVGGVERVT